MVKRPAPDQEPRLTTLIDSIRAAGTTSYRTFATPRELERLLVDDLAVVLSESFRSAAEGTAAPRRSPAGPGEPGEAELPAGTVTIALPGNLPLQVSSFIGRARELGQTAAALGEAG